MIDERTPWHVHARYPFWVEDADGRTIINTEGIYLSPEDNKALARLIASAPALLAELEAAVTWWDRIDDATGEFIKPVWVEYARAAIAQARRDDYGHV